MPSPQRTHRILAVLGPAFLLPLLGTGPADAQAAPGPQPQTLGPSAPQQPLPGPPVPQPVRGQPAVPGSQATPEPSPAGAAPGAPLQPATAEQSPPLYLELTADQQGFDQVQGRFVALGDVKALLNGGRLLADRLEYDPSSRSLLASGRVRFQRGNQYLQASRLRYSLIQQTGQLDHVYGVLDLDSASNDLNPELPAAAPLLQLNYWDGSSFSADDPEFALDGEPRTTASPGAAAAPGGPGQRSGPNPRDQGLKALQLQPLAPGPPLVQSSQRLEALDSATPLGRPEPLNQAIWRMPPVALAPDGTRMACAPDLPVIPEWHPHPWAATVWGGQMIDSNFGETFYFKGRMRPEYLLGVGLNRRLIQAGPLALEFDSNLMGHHAAEQQGGAYNQAVPYANTPSQNFGEITGGFGIRAWMQPWLSVSFVEGVSLNTSVSNYEKTFRENYTTFLNYLGFEIEALVSPQWSLVGRIHHRSGAYGTYAGVSEGSNAYLLGLRYRFGEGQDARPKLAMAPPEGCPDPDRRRQHPPVALADQLNTVALGSKAQAMAPAAPLRSPASIKSQMAGRTPAEQERLRRQAIEATADQRVSDLQYEGSLQGGRRFGSNDGFNTKRSEITYGAVTPEEIQTQRTIDNKSLVSGTITRWRFEANTINLSPSGWKADRVAFTNDPYTPAQSWLDSEDVVARVEANGDTVVESRRSRVILEDRLPIPMGSKQRFEKKQEINNAWVTGSDSTDRDGFYIGRNLKPIGLGKKGSLELQPQFMVRRALDGVTSSYILPGQPPSDNPSSQTAKVGDFFGLLAKLNTPVLGFNIRATADISTFDPSNFANGNRSWGEIKKSINLPVLGEITARGFGAYRYRAWNGSLGQTDIYSAYGVSLENSGNLPSIGKLTSSYFWRAGHGNFQGTGYGLPTFVQLWRSSFFGSISSSLPIWTGRPLPPGPEAGTRYSAIPITPGLSLNTNVNTGLFSYSDGSKQNTITLSGGPTLTLGHFSRTFLDYTRFTITGGGTLLDGASPLSFDRAVDLSTIGLGMSQQLFGPLVLSGGIGLNVNGRSPNYGDVTGSYVELRWQRRAYEVSIFYSPYEELGGIKIRLNDFNFGGTGVPFVPYHATGLNPASQQDSPF